MFYTLVCKHLTGDMQMKFSIMKISQMMGALVLLLGAATASAELIQPNNPGLVNPGDSFTVLISGSGFANGTVGGGLSVAWDPNRLSLVGYDTSVFPGDMLVTNSTTVLDAPAGTLSNLDFGSFDPVLLSDFDLVALSFTALAPGVSPINLSIGHYTLGGAALWFDSNYTQLDPVFAAGQVTIVPVPAALWLMGSGLLWLAGIARRKHSV